MPLFFFFFFLPFFSSLWRGAEYCSACAFKPDLVQFDYESAHSHHSDSSRNPSLPNTPQKSDKSPLLSIRDASHSPEEPIHQIAVVIPPNNLVNGIPPFDTVGRLSSSRDGRIDFAVAPEPVPDTRVCRLCNVAADLSDEEEGRLLFDPTSRFWVHGKTSLSFCERKQRTSITLLVYSELYLVVWGGV